MTEHHDALDRLTEHRLVAVLRGHDPDGTCEAAKVLAEAGIELLEVTLTVPRALEVISRLREELPDHIVGAGTATTPTEVTAAAAAGAQFVVSPGAPAALLPALLACGVATLPGVFTASELMSAEALGFAAVKLFPAAPLGVDGLRQLRGPFPDVRIVPTGGIGVDEVGSWLRAGARAVGLGGALCSAVDIERRAWADVTARARDAIRQADEVTR